jgi:hypothetical protein
MTTTKSAPRKRSTMPTTALEAYKALQKSLRIKPSVDIEEEDDSPSSVDFLGSISGPLLQQCIEFAIAEVSKAKRVPCISKVTGKSYFAFERIRGHTTFLSRPVNSSLFSDDLEPIKNFFSTLEKSACSPKKSIEGLESWDTNLLQRTLYSMVMAFCCAVDIQKTGDKKTPGTFFEYFIGYVFSRRFNVNPVRRVEINLRGGKKVPLTTDFLFDPAPNKKKLHVPVKTSTRERIIQVWAHQKVLDGTQGNNLYLGTPVLLTETKLNKKKMEVVEICLPDQWRIYQGHISQLARVYYLDLPKPYEALNEAFPHPIIVKPFAEFFAEADALL